MKSFVYAQSNNEKVTEYSKEIRETDEELVISFTFNQEIESAQITPEIQSAIEIEGLVEFNSKL